MSFKELCWRSFKGLLFLILKTALKRFTLKHLLFLKLKSVFVAIVMLTVLPFNLVKFKELIPDQILLPTKFELISVTIWFLLQNELSCYELKHLKPFCQQFLILKTINKHFINCDKKLVIDRDLNFTLTKTKTKICFV